MYGLTVKAEAGRGLLPLYSFGGVEIEACRSDILETNLPRYQTVGAAACAAVCCYSVFRGKLESVFQQWVKSVDSRKHL